jgi:hypothetical protein
MIVSVPNHVFTSAHFRAFVSGGGAIAAAGVGLRLGLRGLVSLRSKGRDFDVALFF